MNQINSQTSVSPAAPVNAAAVGERMDTMTDLEECLGRTGRFLGAAGRLLWDLQELGASEFADGPTADRVQTQIAELATVLEAARDECARTRTAFDAVWEEQGTDPKRLDAHQESERRRAVERPP